VIEVRRGAPDAQGAEAVLRPVDAALGPVSAGSRRLELEAGDSVTSRLRDLAELPVGGAVITPAGNLSADFVIHVVVRSVEEPVTAVGVERALVNGLRRAAEFGVASVALAPVGTGPGNLDPESAARLLIDVVAAGDEAGAWPTAVTIAVDSDYDEELYRRLASAAGSAAP
jgi:O-acetyl-ADP-ribose deacetylase (regulator of RNase III)